MSLEIHAPKADALARELATATGEDIDTAVVRAIEERLARTPRQRPADEKAAIEALFDRLAQLPVLDHRSPDEISAMDQMACRTDGYRYVGHLCSHYRRAR